MPFLAQVHVQQFVLEYATPRAGDLVALEALHGSKALGLGVVSPRTTEVESVEDIVARVSEASAYVPAERIFLNLDCGFGTFARRPMNTPDLAAQKLAAMVRAAAVLREQYADHKIS